MTFNIAELSKGLADWIVFLINFTQQDNLTDLFKRWLST